MQQPHFNSQISQTYAVYVNPYGMRRLSPHFQPGKFDVLCARGKLAYDHDGNRRFRALVKQHQTAYSAATCKYEKSKIVSFIVSAVRNASPEGGFIKNIDSAWYEVGDRHAKEKVGQTFRDLLHTKYSSSTKAKARARVQRRIQEQDVKEDEPEDSSKKPKKSNKPDTVSSKDASMRSSVSVVSAEGECDSHASTVPKSNNNRKELPPLASVVVTKTTPPPTYAHPGQQFLPQVSPSQSQRTQSSFLQALRAAPGSRYPPQAPPSMPMFHHTSDLEPLPLNLGASVKVDFNASTSSEESFDDVMNDFVANMSVAV